MAATLRFGRTKPRHVDDTELDKLIRVIRELADFIQGTGVHSTFAKKFVANLRNKMRRNASRHRNASCPSVHRLPRQILCRALNCGSKAIWAARNF